MYVTQLPSTSVSPKCKIVVIVSTTGTALRITASEGLAYIASGQSRVAFKRINLKLLIITLFSFSGAGGSRLLFQKQIEECELL